MEENIKLLRDFKDIDANIDFYAISCDDDKNHRGWVDFIKAKKWSQMLNYRDKNIMTYLEIGAIPHLILVDCFGKIAYWGHPSKINLKEMLVKISDLKGGDSGYTGNKNEEKKPLTIEEQILKKEDPNPHWETNSREDREEIVNSINDMLKEQNIAGVKFLVSTKILYCNGNTSIMTQPIFSGYIVEGNLETIQEMAITVTEAFGLNDVQYNLNMLTDKGSSNIDMIKNIFKK
jgi:hypothetical protein